MNLEENKDWKRIVGNSKDDDYIKACVDVARETMRLLSEDNTPLHAGYYPDKHTPHGLVCIAGHNVHVGDITGVMIGYIALMVAEFHDRGEEFGAIWSDSIKTNGIVNPA